MNKKIYIAGHNGLVGSALFRKAKELDFNDLIVKSRQELDLTDREQVFKFFNNEKHANK